MCGDAAAGERHERAGVVFVRGRMGSHVRGADTSRGLGIVAAEYFGVNPLRCETERREGFFHVRHELGWAAEINVGVSGDADFIEEGARQPTGKVEIFSHFVVRARSAVADIRLSIRELAYQAADFTGEWMMFAIASRMEPEDLACRTIGCERVQHGQDRSRANSRAEQHRGLISCFQNESSAGITDVENISHAYLLFQIGPCCAMRFDLYADAVALR